jgi:methylthioribulose-1-phosphate dehydratase
VAAPHVDVVTGLIRAGKRFDARGWVLGTSGNFSAVVSTDPLRLAITRSGTHKGELAPVDILELDGTGAVTAGQGAPSAETRLHLEIVARRAAGAVLHTHSIWSTFLSDRLPGGFDVFGYEMLKGLAGVKTHEHREWMPVIENDQDMDRLALEVQRILDEYPECHGFLIHRHGLYTWGQTLPEAIRHVEILEFLLETVGRARYSAPVPEEAVRWRL